MGPSTLSKHLIGFYCINTAWTSHLHQTPERLRRNRQCHHSNGVSTKFSIWGELSLSNPPFSYRTTNVQRGKNASSKHLMFSSTEMKTWEDGWAYQWNVYDKHTFLTSITMISSAFLTTSPATTSRKARRVPKVEREQPLCCDSSPNPKPPRMRRSNQSAVSYCRIKDINSYEKNSLTHHVGSRWSPAARNVTLIRTSVCRFLR